MSVFGIGAEKKRNTGNASNGDFTLTGITKPKRHKAMEWPVPTDKRIRRNRP